MKASPWISGAFSLLLLLCANGLAQSLKVAEAAAREGRIDASLAALQTVPNSAEVDALRCSLYASIEQRDLAVKACEAASAADPSNSNYALELARAYGAKADSGGMLTGMRMVGKIRDNFERAEHLDAKNIEALSDLGQFYVEAPGVVGGGVDKARALLPRLQALSPARAHRLAGMIAAKGKNDAVAEQEFQAALNVSHSAEAYVDLANFARSRKALEQAVQYAGQAMEHDPHHGPDTLDAAAILIDLKRNLPEAQTGLQAYLKTPQQKVASYAKAHVLLGKCLRAGGDPQGAKEQFQASVALARNYAAAQQGLER